MARARLTVTNAPGAYPTAGIVATATAADATNFNDALMTGSEVLVAFNSGVSTRTITIESVANAAGRVKDITTENITAGQWRVYGPFRDKSAWAQSGGLLNITATHADVKFYWIKL